MVFWTTDTIEQAIERAGSKVQEIKVQSYDYNHWNVRFILWNGE